MTIPSVRELALQAAFSQLEALVDDDAALQDSIHRNRQFPLTPEEAPALIMMDGGMEPVELENTYAQTFDVDFAVEVAVLGDDDAAVTAAVDEYFSLITNAIIGDHTLGGVVQDAVFTGMDDPDRFDEPGAPNGAEYVLRYSLRIEIDPSDVTSQAPA